MSRQSLLSANVKGDDDMLPGAVHRAPDIYLTADKTPIISDRRPSMKAVRPVIASKGIPYLQTRQDYTARQEQRREERRKRQCRIVGA